MRNDTKLDFGIQLTDHSGMLRPFAMKLTQDSQEANDLVQDTLLKALIHRDKFRVDSNLRAWLMTIMKNTFINGRKRASRIVKLDTSNDFEINRISNFTVDNLGPSHLNFKEILKLIRKVEGNYRKAFLLHVAGYKYEEIAQNLDIPLGTVKVRIHRARKTLRHNLQPLANRSSFRPSGGE